MTSLRAAVIGASGIGKHHAKWLHYEGCEVVAFVGTSVGSVAKTAKLLQELFGFEGRGYTSVEEMLATAQPEVLSVASPPEHHYEHVLACAQAGVHVMCEKPLVWYSDRKPREMMALAEEMVEMVDDRALVGAINTQYVAGLEPYFELSRRLGIEREAPRSMFMQLDSRGARGPVDFEAIWRDLGSHPISVMMAFCGYGQIDRRSLRVTCRRKEFDANFVYVPEAGPPCECHLRSCNVPEGPLVRRMGINGHLMDYEGRNDDKGVYRAFCTMEGQELWWDDFMQLSFRSFVAAVKGEDCPLASMRDGLANLGFHLQTLGAAKREE